MTRVSTVRMHPESLDSFRQIETWIFDLDNTLYPARCDLFTQIKARITVYIMTYLGLDAEAAGQIQRTYARQYGTSLQGLMRHHGMPPGPFLDFVHDIDTSVLCPDPAFALALTRLPGRKVVHTNGSVAHAENILRTLALFPYFDALFGIEDSDFIPKPDPRSSQTLCQSLDIEPGTAIMIEDTKENLAPAKQMGMITVLVGVTSDEQATTPYVDIFIEDTAPWLIDISQYV